MENSHQRTTWELPAGPPSGRVVLLLEENHSKPEGESTKEPINQVAFTNLS